MNIDERLDRLTERHEALTQSVELQGHHIEALTRRMDATMDAIDKLVQLAASHERRLDHLES